MKSKFLVSGNINDIYVNSLKILGFLITGSEYSIWYKLILKVGKKNFKNLKTEVRSSRTDNFWNVHGRSWPLSLFSFYPTLCTDWIEKWNSPSFLYSLSIWEHKFYCLGHLSSQGSMYVKISIIFGKVQVNNYEIVVNFFHISH